MARWMWEGSVEDVTVRISETSGQDLSSTSVYLLTRSDMLVPDADDPDWSVPDLQRAGSVVRATKLITGTKVDGKVTKHWVWVKLVDNPEEIIAKAGYYRVR